ncbi:Uncharacterised protein [Bordetella pertussis]|nr:Uncharacterised protein [Bordetella pertussis]
MRRWNTCSRSWKPARTATWRLRAWAPSRWRFCRCCRPASMRWWPIASMARSTNWTTRCSSAWVSS